MERQRYALTAITVSTWGFSINEMVEVHKAVIRSAIAYGANAIYTGTKRGEKYKGAVKTPGREQNNWLKAALGGIINIGLTTARNRSVNPHSISTEQDGWRLQK